MPFDSGLFDQDVFDGGGSKPLALACTSIRAQVGGYVIKQAAAVAHSSTALALAGCVIRQAAALARSAATMTAAGIRLKLAAAIAHTTATLSAASGLRLLTASLVARSSIRVSATLNKMMLPPLGRGLRVGRWERPAGGL